MKHLLLPAITFLFASTSSCRKLIDYIHDNPNAHDSLCRITRIVVIGAADVPDTMDVTYNAKGNPIKMAKSNWVYQFVNYDKHFRYDRFDRLTEYITTFAGTTSVSLWHKYGYPRYNFITDTTMTIGADLNQPTPIATDAYYYYIVGYTIDGLGRIVKHWAMPRAGSGDSASLITDIVYDANGNLPLYNANLKRDDKVNVFRTNKIWQFIFDDYSLNNAVPKGPSAPAVTYNNFGLPTSYPNLEPYNRLLFELRNFSPFMQIEYACSMPKGPISY